MVVLPSSEREHICISGDFKDNDGEKETMRKGNRGPTEYETETI